MIRRPDPCPTEALSLLMRDELEQSEQESITAHLDSCEDCRQRLEHTITSEDVLSEAQEFLRNDTAIELLSPASTLAHLPPQRNGTLSSGLHNNENGPEPGLSSHWVLGLLNPPTEPGFLGRIDDLHVSRVIGQGGMGVVLQAWDPELQRFLAVKLLSPMLSHSGAARQRFLREAQSTAAIVHPNIVPIFTVSAEQELPHIVMPYIGGGSLQHLIDETGPIPLQRTLALGLQVAEGLAAAHQQGIIHRDIKPANLMLDEGGFRVMLTDFGLARALDEAGATGATLTGTGAVAGTPQYMSPEQARGELVDHRTDLYSLGAVLYALATGRVPINATSTLEILRKIGKEKSTPIAEINEAYPLWFQSIVDQLMHPAKEKRIQSAQEASLLLKETLAHVRAPTRIALPATLATKKFPAPRAAAIGLISTLLLVAIWIVAPWQYLSRMGGPDNSEIQSTSTNNPTGNAKLTDSPELEWNGFFQVTQELNSLEADLHFLDSELGGMPSTATAGESKP